MKTCVQVWRRPVPWCASLLLVLLVLLGACSGPTGSSTSLSVLATATAVGTALPTNSPTATIPATSTPRPRPTPTLTPRPKPTPTPTPRPKPTATPTPRPTATPTPTPTPQTVVVTISNFAFSPASVTITVGTTVEWVNKDSTMHTTTSDSGDPASWDSGPLATNATFSFTFTTAGTYGYHCAIHPFMTGTIVVSG